MRNNLKRLFLQNYAEEIKLKNLFSTHNENLFKSTYHDFLLKTKYLENNSVITLMK